MEAWIIGLGTAGVVILTLLPLARAKVWWIRGADFPRAQLAVLGLVLCIASLTLLRESEAIRGWLAGANALAVSYQLWWIWPYTLLFRREVKRASPDMPRGDSLTILSVNVLMTNTRADELRRLVRATRPDVLITLETNSWWERALSSLEQEYPHRLRCPLENLYGMHLYSRLPLEDAKIQFLVESRVPSMHTLLVLPSGRRVCLHCLHPAPPSPTENETSGERDAELVMVGKSVAREKFPVVVSGDLNDVAWSRTTRLFRKVSGLLDPRIGRGMHNTYHAAYWFARWPVDHFFVSRDFTVHRLERLPAIGSDHFPVLIELQCGDLPPAAEAPRPDATDEKDAEEALRNEAVSSTEVHRPGESAARAQLSLTESGE